MTKDNEVLTYIEKSKKIRQDTTSMIQGTNAFKNINAYKAQEDLLKQMSEFVRMSKNSVNDNKKLLQLLKEDRKFNNESKRIEADISKDTLQTLLSLEKASKTGLELAKSGGIKALFSENERNKNTKISDAVLKQIQRQIEINYKAQERAMKKREYYENHPVLGRITGYTGNILTNFFGEGIVRLISSPFKSMSEVFTETIKGVKNARDNNQNLFLGGIKGLGGSLIKDAGNLLKNAGENIRHFFINEQAIDSLKERWSWDYIKNQNIERAAKASSMNDLQAQMEWTKGNRLIKKQRDLINVQGTTLNQAEAIFSGTSELNSNLDNRIPEAINAKDITNSVVNDRAFASGFTEVLGDLLGGNVAHAAPITKEKDILVRNDKEIKEGQTKELKQINKKLDNIIEKSDTGDGTNKGGILSSILKGVLSLAVLKKLLSVPGLLKTFSLAVLSTLGSIIKGGAGVVSSVVGTGLKIGSKVLKSVPIIGNVAGAVIAGGEGLYNMYKTNQENKELLAGGQITEEEAKIRLEGATVRAATNTALGALGPAGLIADIAGAGNFTKNQWTKYRRKNLTNEQIPQATDEVSLAVPDALTINEATFKVEPEDTTKLLKALDVENIAHWDNSSTQIINASGESKTNPGASANNYNNSTTVINSNSNEGTQNLPNYVPDPAMQLVFGN